jgi:hypothetical protein
MMLFYTQGLYLSLFFTKNQYNLLLKTIKNYFFV